MVDEPMLADDRKFFCSELVVKALKVCGIMMPTEEASTNFLPADLSSESQRLQLIEGALLGPDQLILSTNMYDSD